MVGIERRLKEQYLSNMGFSRGADGEWPEDANRWWRENRNLYLDETLARIERGHGLHHEAPLVPGMDHKTRRAMERHPLDYSYSELVRSRVRDKLLADPSRLSFEERYYVQTGERYVPSPYPEARYGEAQPTIERFFDPGFWREVLEYLGVW